MDIYAVYLTSYSGNKLPPFYIGSSSVKKIEKGYRGSVRSKKYKNLWEKEIKEHPYLFKTIIISTHKTRKEATEKEHKLQKQLGVVKSDMYVNMSLATTNGFFGMIVSGSDHPIFGRKYTDQQNKENSKRIKNVWENPNSVYHSEEYKNKKVNQNCRKKYVVFTPENEKINIINLNAFCRENGLTKPLMIAVLKGRQNHHKNYKIFYDV